MNCAPCPFCDAELKPQYNQKRTEVIAYAHPLNGCFMNGHNIGVKLIPKWNKRAAISDDPLIHFLTRSLALSLTRGPRPAEDG